MFYLSCQQTINYLIYQNRFAAKLWTTVQNMNLHTAGWIWRRWINRKYKHDCFNGQQVCWLGLKIFVPAPGVLILSPSVQCTSLRPSVQVSWVPHVLVTSVHNWAGEGSSPSWALSWRYLLIFHSKKNTRIFGSNGIHCRKHYLWQPVNLKVSDKVEHEAYCGVGTRAEKFWIL